MRTIKRFANEEAGPTATEYAVMLALIIVVCLIAIGGIGTKVNAIFTSINTGLSDGTAS